MSQRKRAVSDLLSDNEESTTTRSFCKSRAVFRILNEESEESTPITPIRSTHKRRMEICNCSKCKGKLIDIHAKITHDVNNSEDDQNSEVSP